MSVSSDRLRELALALPDVVERETWDHPTFRLRDKILVGLTEPGLVTLKASPDDQARCVATDPDVFSPAPRGLGDSGWLRVRLAGVPVDELRELLAAAWWSLASAEQRAAHPELAAADG